MICAALPVDADYSAWRAVARRALASGTPPESIVWTESDLFADQGAADENCAAFRAPRAFVDVAESAACHADPARFGLLYRVLWRLQRDRTLMQDGADADVAALQALAKAVRREVHKMHAFVRFREVTTKSGPTFLAWFEPLHYVERAAADFFVRRFAGMRWSIITPRMSITWNGEALAFGAGGARADVPAADARDADWRAYYQSMFNPARLKLAAMQQEMPKRYWRNLPEAQDIPALIEAASGRAVQMLAASPTTARKRAGAALAQVAPRDVSEIQAAIAQRQHTPLSLEDVREALRACRACPLWRDTTQAVPGEGAANAPLLALVGEQPGDQEDLAGRPFVGPAGQVLDRALKAASIDRSALFITNAVKHFKHEPRGKRRLHKRPERGEIEACRWWVTHELELVRPKLVLALGLTAVQSLSALRGPLIDLRGETFATREGRPMRATMHPSYLLRLPDEAARTVAFDALVGDLKAAQALAETL